MTPALRYYRALVGAWSGRFTLTITDPRAFREGAAPWLTKLGLAPVALVPRLGVATMATTLQPQGDGDSPTFRHTTRVSRWGVTLFATDEVISLGDDGRSIHMSGSQRMGPGGAEPYESEGEVDEAATRATYRILWVGEPLVQRTAIVPEGLELSQETRWSRAMVLLRRVGGPAS